LVASLLGCWTHEPTLAVPGCNGNVRGAPLGRAAAGASRGSH
jgi:hypothetical protein